MGDAASGEAESGPYRVRERAGRFEVVGSAERVALTCRDAHTAEQYAVALNQAYRQGFQAGFRHGRGSALA